MMLPSKERRPFAGKVHELKKKNLNNMVMDGKLPLRPGQASHLRLPACHLHQYQDTDTTCFYWRNDCKLYCFLGTTHAAQDVTQHSTMHIFRLLQAHSKISHILLNSPVLAIFCRHSKLHRHSFREGHRSWAGSRDLLHPRGADHDSSSVCIGRGAK